MVCEKVTVTVLALVLEALTSVTACALGARKSVTQSATRAEAVAQIFNLLYRGFATRRPSANLVASFQASGLPTASRRYSRLQICATGFAPAREEGRQRRSRLGRRKSDFISPPSVGPGRGIPRRT